MNSTNIVNVVSFGTNSLFWLIVGLLLSIVISVCSKMMLNYIYRPKIHYTELESVRYRSTEIGFIRIQNKGRRATEHCSATLRISDVETTSVISTTPETYNGPIKKSPAEDGLLTNLCWAETNPSAARQLNPNEEGTLWVYKRSENGNIIIPSELGWETPAFVLSESERPYQVIICVTTEKNTSYNREITIP